MELQQDIEEAIAVFENFPKEGISFKDVMPIFQSPSLLRSIVETSSTHVRDKFKGTCIVSPEARGFLFGAIVAYELGIKFVPARKIGKLPGPVESGCYSLEYGENTLCIQSGSISKEERVVIIDDLLATGGTAQCIKDLVGDCFVGSIFILQLDNVYEQFKEKCDFNESNMVCLCHLQG